MTAEQELKEKIVERLASHNLRCTTYELDLFMKDIIEALPALAKEAGYVKLREGEYISGNSICSVSTRYAQSQFRQDRPFGLTQDKGGLDEAHRR